VNKSLKLISDKEYSSLSPQDINTVLGSLVVVAGWINPIRTGSQVLAKINGKETICDVVDGGFNSGKLHTSILINGDESRIVRKFPIEELRPYDKFKIGENL
jgi:hypothetical protein